MTVQGASLALVLGAGGVRGIAHVGVLQALAARGVRPDAVIGVSVGSLVAACYASLGWDAEALERASRGLGPLGALALALRRPWLSPLASRLGQAGGTGRGLGAVGALLADLEAAGFESLHHGVRHLGILCHDRVRRGEVLFLSGRPEGRPSLRDCVLGSMTLPVLFPMQTLNVSGRSLRLIDGGFARTVPIEAAAAPPVSARRILAVSLGVMPGEKERGLAYQRRLAAAMGDRLRVVRPRVNRFGIVVMKRGDPERLLQAGRDVVTDDVAAFCSVDGPGGVQ